MDIVRHVDCGGVDERGETADGFVVGSKGTPKKGEYIKQPWFESMSSKMFRTLEKNLGWHLLITAKLK